MAHLSLSSSGVGARSAWPTAEIEARQRAMGPRTTDARRALFLCFPEGPDTSLFRIRA